MILLAIRYLYGLLGEYHDRFLDTPPPQQILSAIAWRLPTGTTLRLQTTPTRWMENVNRVRLQTVKSINNEKILFRRELPLIDEGTHLFLVVFSNVFITLAIKMSDICIFGLKNTATWLDKATVSPPHRQYFFELSMHLRTPFVVPD